MSTPSADLIQSIENRTATVGVIGLGYVGLPLVLLFQESGFRVVGFDVDAAKTEALARGESYIRQYNLQRALEQFDLAVKAGDGDFYQQSIVEARLNELKQRVDKPKKEGWFN